MEFRISGLAVDTTADALVRALSERWSVREKGDDELRLYGGAATLSIYVDRATPSGTHDWLLGGVTTKAQDESEAFVKELGARLEEAGIGHRFELSRVGETEPCFVLEHLR